MELSLVTFALLAMVVVMTPGPTVLLALSNGSRFGLAIAGYGIAGAALSDAVLIAAAGLGLGAIMATSALMFNVVKWVGVAYLFWLGIQMLRSSGDIGAAQVQATGPATSPARHKLRIFRKSFLVAVTNPKGYLFFTAFLPQFLTPTDPLFVQYVVLAAVFICVDVVVMTVYAGFGVKAVQFLSQSGALWIDRVCGGLLMSLGCVLALVRRGAA